CLINVVSDQCPCGLPSSLRKGLAVAAMAPLTKRASKHTALLPISVIFEAHRCSRCSRTVVAAAKRRHDYAWIPVRFLTHHNGSHHSCHHFTRRSATRSPSSEAFTWARARASRDITVPIGTP